MATNDQWRRVGASRRGSPPPRKKAGRPLLKARSDSYNHHRWPGWAVFFWRLNWRNPISSPAVNVFQGICCPNVAMQIALLPQASNTSAPIRFQRRIVDARKVIEWAATTSPVKPDKMKEKIVDRAHRQATQELAAA